MTQGMFNGARRALAFAVFGAATVAGPAAEAEELRISLGLPEVHAFFKPLENFGARLKEAGFDSKVFALQLLSAGEASNGVRDGIADIAMVLFAYSPNEFSETNLTADLSMLATSGTPAHLPSAAMAGATMEYVFLNCPDCLAQFKAQNQVFLTDSSTSDYTLICNGEIKTVEDLAGKKLRASAGNYIRIAEFFGATAVNIKGAETYDALSHGVVDCTMNPIAELVGIHYIDVTDSALTGFPGGVFSGVGLANMNRDRWQALDPAQREIVLRAAAALAADGVVHYEEEDAASIAKAKEQGYPIFEAGEALRARVTEFVTQDMAVIEDQFSTKYGLKNVPQKIARIRELVEKWKGLTNAAGADREKLATLYWNEIYAKLDLASYGMD